MSVSDEKTTVSDGIMLSDSAAGKVKALLDQEGRDDLALRVAVQPGGCSGLRYQLFFDERSLDGDVVKDFGGVKVVTDRMSAPYLGGASIDFVDTIEKQGFTIDNPNATGSCACGAPSAESRPTAERITRTKAASPPTGTPPSRIRGPARTTQPAPVATVPEAEATSPRRRPPCPPGSVCRPIRRPSGRRAAGRGAPSSRTPWR